MNLLANNPAKSFRLALVDTSLATKVIIANIFLILSAKISVPFYPVPLSLQTLAIMAIALFTNRKIAMVSTTLYLLEGLLGMPVFTTMESGPIVFLGTRGGYLLGFLLLSYVCSTSKEIVKNNFLNTLIIQFAGLACVYVLGVGYLTLLIGFNKAVYLGLLPFMFGAVCKVFLVALANNFYHRFRA